MIINLPYKYNINEKKNPITSYLLHSVLGLDDDDILILIPREKKAGLLFLQFKHPNPF